MEKSLPRKDSLLSRKQAAEYLGGICLTTLDRLKIDRTIIRRRVFYRPDVLEQWLVKHTQGQEVSNE